MSDRTGMMRPTSGPVSIALAVIVALAPGCSSVTGGRPNVPSEVRTLTSIGDQDLPVRSGEPGSTIAADDETPTRITEAAASPAITGRVVDDRGDPVPGAEVRVAISGTSRGRTTRTESDEAGRFKLPNLREDAEYTVIAEVEDEQGRLVSGRRKVRAPRGQIEIVLGPEGNEPDEIATPSVGRASRRSAAGVDGAASTSAVASGRDVRSDLNEDLPPAAEAEELLVDAGGPVTDSLDRDVRGGTWRRADGSGDADASVGPAKRDGQTIANPLGDEDDEEGPNPLPPALDAAPGAAGRLLEPEPNQDLRTSSPEPLPLPSHLAPTTPPTAAASESIAGPPSGAPTLEAVPSTPAPPEFPPDPGDGGSTAKAASAAGASAAASEALIQKALEGPAAAAPAPPMSVDPTTTPSPAPAAEVTSQPPSPSESPTPGPPPSAEPPAIAPTPAAPVNPGPTPPVADPVFPPLTGEALVPVPSLTEPGPPPQAAPAVSPEPPGLAPPPLPGEPSAPGPTPEPQPAPTPAPVSPPAASPASPAPEAPVSPPADAPVSPPAAAPAPEPAPLTPPELPKDEPAPAPAAEEPKVEPAPSDSVNKTALGAVKATTWGAVAATDALLPPLSRSTIPYARRVASGPRDEIQPTRAMTTPPAISAPETRSLTPEEAGADEVLQVRCDYDAKRSRLEDFTLPDLEGNPVRFRELGGDAELVLLDFWGTWCGPCLRTVPHLQEIQRSSGGRVRVVGIAYENTDPDTAADRVAATAKRLRINYPLLLGGIDGKSCPVQRAFNVRAFPTLVLLDRSGQVLWSGSGADAKTVGEVRARIASHGRKDMARR
jgi:thiol-disulfide isomerase/thioredoxin